MLFSVLLAEETWHTIQQKQTSFVMRLWYVSGMSASSFCNVCVDISVSVIGGLKQSWKYRTISHCNYCNWLAYCDVSIVWSQVVAVIHIPEYVGYLCIIPVHVASAGADDP